MSKPHTLSGARTRPSRCGVRSALLTLECELESLTVIPGDELMHVSDVAEATTTREDGLHFLLSQLLVLTLGALGGGR